MTGSQFLSFHSANAPLGVLAFLFPAAMRESLGQQLNQGHLNGRKTTFFREPTSSMEYSDIARRFTNLFEKPDIVEYKKKFYEAGLIQKTVRGELVRSKSEVIIADALLESGIDYYEYEKELDLAATV